MPYSEQAKGNEESVIGAPGLIAGIALLLVAWLGMDKFWAWFGELRWPVRGAVAVAVWLTIGRAILRWIGRGSRASRRRRLPPRELSPAVDRLIPSLTSADWERQAAAFEELRGLNDPTAEIFLLRAVEGETYRHVPKASATAYFMIVSRAAAALARLDTDLGFEALEDRLQESDGQDETTTSALVYGLGFSPRPRAREIVLGAAGADEKVKSEALARLERAGKDVPDA